MTNFTPVKHFFPARAICYCLLCKKNESPIDYFPRVNFPTVLYHKTLSNKYHFTATGGKKGQSDDGVHNIFRQPACCLRSVCVVEKPETSKKPKMSRGLDVKHFDRVLCWSSFAPKRRNCQKTTNDCFNQHKQENGVHEENERKSTWKALVRRSGKLRWLQSVTQSSYTHAYQISRAEERIRVGKKDRHLTEREIESGCTKERK